jgi:hypothetical protein
MPGSPLYDRDFYAWATEQAALLRDGKLAEADIEHIAEEIESMGRTEKRALVSRLTILLVHLLKWRFQPDKRGRRWRLSMEEQRILLVHHLADNPSLKAMLPQAIADSYRLALIAAQRETNLDAAAFPRVCPWSFQKMIADDFWPEGAE